MSAATAVCSPASAASSLTAASSSMISFVGRKCVTSTCPPSAQRLSAPAYARDSRRARPLRAASAAQAARRGA